MRHFIVASHGPLSGAILKSAALIAGEETFHNFTAIQVTMEDSGDEIRRTVDQIFFGFAPEDEIIALTDVIGGNVTNILTEYVKIRNLHIVAGMNLGMVLEAGFSDESTPAAMLADSLLSMGKTGIRYINAVMNEESMEDEI